jgi:hypothetical protein
VRNTETSRKGKRKERKQKVFETTQGSVIQPDAPVLRIVTDPVKRLFSQ